MFLIEGPKQGSKEFDYALWDVGPVVMRFTSQFWARFSNDMKMVSTFYIERYNKTFIDQFLEIKCFLQISPTKLLL